MFKNAREQIILTRQDHADRLLLETFILHGQKTKYADVLTECVPPQFLIAASSPCPENQRAERESVTTTSTTTHSSDFICDLYWLYVLLDL